MFSLIFFLFFCFLLLRVLTFLTNTNFSIDCTVKNKGAKYHDFSISRIGRTWIGRKISHFGASTILKYKNNKRSDVSWTRNKSFHRWKISKKNNTECDTTWTIVIQFCVPFHDGNNIDIVQSLKWTKCWDWTISLSDVNWTRDDSFNRWLIQTCVRLELDLISCNDNLESSNGRKQKK